MEGEERRGRERRGQEGRGKEGEGGVGRGLLQLIQVYKRVKLQPNLLLLTTHWCLTCPCQEALLTFLLQLDLSTRMYLIEGSSPQAACIQWDSLPLPAPNSTNAVSLLSSPRCCRCPRREDCTNEAGPVKVRGYSRLGTPPTEPALFIGTTSMHYTLAVGNDMTQPTTKDCLPLPPLRSSPSPHLLQEVLAC